MLELCSLKGGLSLCPSEPKRKNQLLHIKEKVTHLKQKQKQNKRKKNFNPVFNCKNMVGEKEYLRETQGLLASEVAILQCMTKMHHCWLGQRSDLNLLN